LGFQGMTATAPRVAWIHWMSASPQYAASMRIQRGRTP
jgi:hypothetical protein